MTKILLDLFCCEGGAARGYQNAGFEVFGLDITPRFIKRYAGDWFLAGDALTALDDLIEGKSLTFTNKAGASRTISLADVDAIHASPPCQRYSIGGKGLSATAAKDAMDKHPDLVAPTRERLKATGKPWVIENVVGAPLIDPIMLCWGMFYEAGSVLDDDGTPLRMERHRLFESNITMNPPKHRVHNTAVQVAGSYGGARRDKEEARKIRKGGYVPSIPVQRELLGIDWMTRNGMWQSLPPVYTEFIGKEFLKNG